MISPYWGVAVMAACATTPPGASDANLALARSKASRGAEVFGERCASCHGDRGQGTTKAPAVIGGGALLVYPRTSSASNLTTDPNELQLRTDSQLPGAPSRPPFENARNVFGYVVSTMPKDRPGSLREEDGWAVLNFLLRAHGSKLPEAGVDPTNAASVNVQPE